MSMAQLSKIPTTRSFSSPSVAAVAKNGDVETAE